MSMNPTIINAFDIPDAWFQTVQACMLHGYDRPVFRGERKEERRKELDWLILQIRRPCNRPLVPDVPEGVPPVSSEDAINTYLAYIATPDKTQDQDYTYGQRTHGVISIDNEVLKFMEKHDKQEGKNIHANCNQFDVISQFLKETPETNRAIVEVGMAQDLFLKHPPCLRAMHFKIRYGKLHMFLFFRSWDAMYGLPMNLGAYQKLKESLVNDLNIHYTDVGMHKVDDGEMFASSMGAHVYSGQWKYAEQVINRSSSRRSQVT